MAALRPASDKISCGIWFDTTDELSFEVVLRPTNLLRGLEAVEVIVHKMEQNF